MKTSSILPTYKAIFYANDPQTGYYLKTAQQPNLTPVMRLPFMLRVEPTQAAQVKCNALQIIRGKETFKNGAFKFFSGLQNTNFQQWFAGNDYEIIEGQKILSLCIFQFSNDNGRLTVFYFSRFYIDGREPRMKFINDVIPVLQKSISLSKIAAF